MPERFRRVKPGAAPSLSTGKIVLTFSLIFRFRLSPFTPYFFGLRSSMIRASAHQTAILFMLIFRKKMNF